MRGCVKGGGEKDAANVSSKLRERIIKKKDSLIRRLAADEKRFMRECVPRPMQMFRLGVESGSAMTVASPVRRSGDIKESSENCSRLMQPGSTRSENKSPLREAGAIFSRLAETQTQKTVYKQRREYLITSGEEPLFSPLR